MSFNMVRLKLNLGALYQWGRQMRLGDDVGYLVHAASRAIWGEIAPQPFFVQSSKGCVLGYTNADEDQMRAAYETSAAERGKKLLVQALSISHHCCKKMPEQWRKDAVYQFSVFCRPMARNGKIEGDVWLLEMFRAYQDAVGRGEFSGTVQEFRHQNENRREEIYTRWIQRQFASETQQESGKAAQLLRVSIDGLRCGPMTTRGDSKHTGAPRKGRQRNIPELYATGTLRVADPEAFSRLMKRGIGRHRAFGYGMILLKADS
ncbi:MAG: type I-E CRISPR-associated protein Cas6/Cse3/CasE [Pyramidobacter sp.]|nr:type I-E CRISPR-associated protein Cas6/Cse3/CasE [Pyramidobacter sp.]